jgi:hypothetical protein
VHQVALFWGDNDWLCAERDLERIFLDVPNIVINNMIRWEGWNHLDFLYAIDIDNYQNNEILTVLNWYPID